MLPAKQSALITALIEAAKTYGDVAAVPELTIEHAARVAEPLAKARQALEDECERLGITLLRTKDARIAEAEGQVIALSRINEDLRARVEVVENSDKSVLIRLLYSLGVRV